MLSAFIMLFTVDIRHAWLRSRHDHGSKVLCMDGDTNNGSWHGREVFPNMLWQRPGHWERIKDRFAIPNMSEQLFTILDLCVSSLRRGHANLLCIVPILTDDPRRESEIMFAIRLPLLVQLSAAPDILGRQGCRAIGVLCAACSVGSPVSRRAWKFAFARPGGTRAGPIWRHAFRFQVARLPAAAWLEWIAGRPSGGTRPSQPEGRHPAGSTAAKNGVFHHTPSAA